MLAERIRLMRLLPLAGYGAVAGMLAVLALVVLATPATADFSGWSTSCCWASARRLWKLRAPAGSAQGPAMAVALDGDDALRSNDRAFATAAGLIDLPRAKPWPCRR